jgi:type IV secretory pathway VirB2 component (pilin)
VVVAATSIAAQTERATANVLSRPAGQVLVTLAGLVVVAIGVGMIWYGAAKKFEKRLMIARMSGRTRTTAVRLGQAGYVAKGVAFGIVGVLFVEAASTHDPARSRGLDAALRTLLDQPYGPVLLILVAIGFAAFGLYCFLQARYRKVKA